MKIRTKEEEWEKEKKQGNFKPEILNQNQTDGN